MVSIKHWLRAVDLMVLCRVLIWLREEESKTETRKTQRALIFISIFSSE